MGEAEDRLVKLVGHAVHGDLRGGVLRLACRAVPRPPVPARIADAQLKPVPAGRHTRDRAVMARIVVIARRAGIDTVDLEGGAVIEVHVHIPIARLGHRDEDPTVKHVHRVADRLRQSDVVDVEHAELVRDTLEGPIRPGVPVGLLMDNMPVHRTARAGYRTGPQRDVIGVEPGEVLGIGAVHRTFGETDVHHVRPTRRHRTPAAARLVLHDTEVMPTDREIHRAAVNRIPGRMLHHLFAIDIDPDRVVISAAEGPGSRRIGVELTLPHNDGVAVVRFNAFRMQEREVIAGERIGVRPGAGGLELTGSCLEVNGTDKIRPADAEIGGDALGKMQAAKETGSAGKIVHPGVLDRPRARCRALETHVVLHAHAGRERSGAGDRDIRRADDTGTPVDRFTAEIERHMSTRPVSE